jgi:hypothetical protein
MGPTVEWDARTCRDRSGLARRRIVKTDDIGKESVTVGDRRDATVGA